MLARVPLTVRIGLGLILVGVAWMGAWAWWASAANPMWVPLDAPIPALSGHVRTPLKIPLESTYRIFIVARRRVYSDTAPCVAFRGCGDDLPRADWSLFNGKEVVAGGSSLSNSGPNGDSTERWRELGIFQAARGKYVFDVDFVGDGSSLRSGAPRLMVFEMGGWRWDANKQAGGAFIESLLLAVAGIYLIVREAKIRRREMAADLARSYSLTQPGPQPRNLQVNQIAAPAPAVKPTFRLSAPVWTGIFLMLAAAGAYTYVQRWDGQLASALLGLCSIGIGGGASVLAIAGAERFRKPPVPFAAYERHGPLPAHVRWKLGSSKRRPFQGMPSFGLVAFLIYFCTAIPLWLLQPLTPMGLNVHLLPQSPAAPRAPGMDPLLVQVTGHHEVCVNWQPVTWTEFPAVVQKELKRRPPNWPVYVEGDPDLDWQWVAMAIDTIRGLHGEVSLLTTWKGLPRKQLETRTTHKTPGTRSRDRR